MENETLRSNQTPWQIHPHGKSDLDAKQTLSKIRPHGKDDPMLDFWRGQIGRVKFMITGVVEWLMWVNDVGGDVLINGCYRWC